jgi:UDP:flavonoid glycosyltransferase YjiC (YdhE family)
MRVLFTAVAASGHLHPLVPLARALAAAGHEVAFASAEPARALVGRLGFRYFPAGIPFAEASAAVQPRRAADPDGDQPLWLEREMFCGLLPARMVPDLLAIAGAWRPDLIVREATEAGGALAAELLGLPHASVEVGPFAASPFGADPDGVHLNRLRRALGLPPDPDLAALHRHLHLSFVPPSFQDPARPLPATAHALRTVPFDQSGDEALPAWVEELPERPTVHATLGTVFNDRPELIRAIVAGVGGLPVNLVVAVGRDVDPAGFGPLPANVRIERYVPHSLLLPRCAAVVCHGGWNTVLSALGHGLPLVLLPLAGDQPENAARCVRLGAGRALGAAERTPEAIRAATEDVLAAPGYRANAARIQAEMATLPGPELAVALLEDLSVAHRPLLAVG